MLEARQTFIQHPTSSTPLKAGFVEKAVNVALRNALAELLLTALRSREKAQALHLLVAYCVKVEEGGPGVTLGDLGLEGQQQGLRILTDLGLFQIENGAVALLPEFQADLSALRAKAEVYERVLVLGSRDKGEGVGRALRKAALLFNEGLYFEVHELLEAFWMPEEDLLKKRFLQGLIQIAVAFHHLLNGNYEGAASLLKEGAEKLRGYRPCSLGVELEGFLTGIERCREALEQIGPHGLKAFDHSIIPNMDVRC